MNGFFDPTSLYGGTQNWYDTDFSRSYISPNVPRGEFEKYLTEQGFGGETRRDQYTRGQYGRTQSGYEAALLTNPLLRYADYLRTLGGFDGLWQGLTPDQRGEQPNRYAGPIRWTARG